MHALILAAGEGTRLRPLTNAIPKCMVSLAGRPLLTWQLNSLHQAGITDISIVTGYRREVIEKTYPRLQFFHNSDYATTNMVYSMICAEPLLTSGQDILIAYSDIIYEPKVIQALLDHNAQTDIVIASNSRWRELWQARMENPLSDAESFQVDDSGLVIELGKKTRDISSVQGQYMGLFLIKASEATQIPDLYAALKDNDTLEGRSKKQAFMTAWLQYRIDSGVVAKALPIDGGWLEIDTTEDLVQYEKWFGDDSLKNFCDLSTLMEKH
ncbi:phosphocholine cytidylyltransferase family protein [Desulfococcaceae bacterium OttesenSCG-928-F15]|nr:phosphocholine cytidylyltransferase family protein [Desulfococcaceae bacterium OttesenSCG-928-F15]